MHCTLLVPGLLQPSAPDTGLYRDLQLPALTRLLARGHRGSSAAITVEEWLCRAFAIERQQDWPVAPLTLSADGGDPANAYWLRCDPVHLRPRRDALVLVCGEPIAPTHDEAQALIEALNAHFTVDGLRFHAPHPQRWYVAVANAPRLITHELTAVAGREINRLLPAGDDALTWHQRMNEIQMLLSSHPVNDAREVRDQPAINSVWLWGGGVHPTVRNSAITGVWSDDALARALALASGTPLYAMRDGQESLVSSTGQRDALVLLPQLRDAAGSGDLERWRVELTTLERDWFAPLLAALRERRLARLTLALPDSQRGRSYEIRTADLWKFWRPLRPITDHV